MELPDKNRRLLEDQSELRRVLTTAVRTVCPPWLASDADDLVQEAMIKLWRSGLLDEENPGVASSYLWRVAHSVLVDEIRRRRRRRETALEDEMSGPEIQAGSPGPERQSLSRGVGQAIRECLSGLAPAHRRAVTLHILGHPVSEIAQFLGWNAKKADNAAYRGLAALRQCLAERGVRP